MKSKDWEKYRHKTPKSQKRIFIEQQLALVAKLNRGTLPVHTLTELGNAFGVTRERIRQIAKAQHLLMPYSKASYAASHATICKECGKEFIAPHKNTFYCSAVCRRTYYQKKYWVTLTCLNCGKQYKTTKVRAGRFKKHFCSRFCLGQHMGLKYGWASHNQWHPHYYPDTKEEMRKVLSREFSTTAFGKAFRYKTYMGADNALKNLVIQKKIEKVGLAKWRIL